MFVAGIKIFFGFVAGAVLLGLAVWVLRPLLLYLRAWWRVSVVRTKTPPVAIRRYLVNSGMNELRGRRLPGELQEKIAIAELTAALDDDFAGMEGDLIEDGMARLAEIPTVRCARCRRPIFTHQAQIANGEHYCENCSAVWQARLRP